MFKVDFEETNEHENKTILINYTLGEHNIKVHYIKKSDNEIGFWIDNSLNKFLIGSLGKTFPDMIFFADMFLKMFEPVELIFDLDTKKIIELYYNNNKFDTEKIKFELKKHVDYENASLAEIIKY